MDGHGTGSPKRTGAPHPEATNGPVSGRRRRVRPSSRARQFRPPGGKFRRVTGASCRTRQRRRAARSDGPCCGFR
ncbi:hypothetical protein [Azospirillum argentinense]